MKQKIRAGTQTIRMRIIAIVALCWLLPTLVLGVFMSRVFFSALREKTEHALVAEASYAKDLTVQEIERVLAKSRDVTYDGQILDNYAQSQAGVLRYDEFFVLCRTYWHRMFNRDQTMPFTACFFPEYPNMLIYTAEDADVVLRFIRRVLPEANRQSETLDTKSRYASIDGGLFHIRNLYNRRMERFGLIVLDVDPAVLLAPLLDTQSIWTGQADILLDDYEWLTDSENPLSLARYAPGLSGGDGDLYYADQAKIGDHLLTFRIRVDHSAIYGEAEAYSRLVLLLLVLLVPLEGLILLFVHRSLTQPLLNLARAAERLANGELGLTIPVHGDDEIGRVSTAFNAMSLQMRRMIDKSYREELALRDARISALQSRINPHFMNNALEMMNWQARMEGADTVSQMIEAMSILINATLDRADERTVPLDAEVEIADAYFFFIKQRFGERVSIQKQLDPRLSKVPVPRMIIQTLLENAVEHGISPAGGGIIRLHVYEKGGMLYIDVRNNGQPISPQAQQKIDALLSQEDRATPSEHMGIRNVSLRLRLLYHERAGLLLSSEAGGVTLARIYIPYRFEVDGDTPPGAPSDPGDSNP